MKSTIEENRAKYIFVDHSKYILEARQISPSKDTRHGMFND